MRMLPEKIGLIPLFSQSTVIYILAQVIFGQVIFFQVIFDTTQSSKISWPLSFTFLKRCNKSMNISNAEEQFTG